MARSLCASDTYLNEYPGKAEDLTFVDRKVSLPPPAASGAPREVVVVNCFFIVLYVVLWALFVRNKAAPQLQLGAACLACYGFDLLRLSLSG